MNTTILVKAYATGNYPQQEMEYFYALACANLLDAAKGLEPLGDTAAADYLTAHQRLFNGVSYLPNVITAEMLSEARAQASSPQVLQILKDRF